MGHRVGQVALRFRGDDYRSLMMEENVVSPRAPTYRDDVGRGTDRLVRDAGYRPSGEGQDYTFIEAWVAA